MDKKSPCIYFVTDSRYDGLVMDELSDKSELVPGSVDWNPLFEGSLQELGDEICKHCNDLKNSNDTEVLFVAPMYSYGTKLVTFDRLKQLVKERVIPNASNSLPITITIMYNSTDWNGYILHSDKVTKFNSQTILNELKLNN